MSASKPQQANAGAQVGGHGGALSLLFENDKVYKPNNNPKEHDFYLAVNKGEAPLVASLGLAPKYFGTETRDTPYGKIEYLIMEDVLKGFKNPSVLDIKMGTQTWHDECSAEKRKKHIEQDNKCTQASLGFRFCGMKVFDSVNKKPVKLDKKFGWYCLETEDMIKALSTFLNDGKRVRADVIPTFLDRIDSVAKFLQGGHWAFYASSLLFVYDADEPGAHPPAVYMIDFAHAVRLPAGEIDKGFLHGIQNLKKFFKTIKDSNPQ